MLGTSLCRLFFLKRRHVILSLPAEGRRSEGPIAHRTFELRAILCIPFDMAHLPSLQHIVDVSRATFLRFPLTVLLAVFTSVSFTILIHADVFEAHPMGRVALVAMLGISLSFAIQLRAEYAGWTGGKRWLAIVLPLALLVAYGATLPSGMQLIANDSHHTYRFVMLFITSHLIVAFLPTRSGFWRFNQSLFLRILLGALYSLVLHLALSIAIVSLDTLFNLNISPKTYGYMLVWVAFTFNTLFFLAGIPTREELEAPAAFPNGLRVFAQYLLIPIVLLYGLILYAYLGKIIVLWSWPEGWVTWLVIGYSIVGIIAFLLVHPLLDDSENPWVRLFSKFYYTALLPLSVLQMLAVWERISAYGITENRYLAMVTGIWLISVIVVLIRSRATQIRYIPVSLAFVILVIMIGPWGMFSVSKSSQRSQLEQVLMDAGVTERPLSSTSGAALDSLGTVRTGSILQYLYTTHGTESLQGFVADSTLARLDTTGRRNGWEHIHDIKAAVGLRDESNGGNLIQYIQIVKYGEPVPTLGFAYSRQIQFNAGEMSSISDIRFDVASQTLSDGIDSVSVTPMIDALMVVTEPKVEDTQIRFGSHIVLFIDVRIENGRMQSGQAVILSNKP